MRKYALIASQHESMHLTRCEHASLQSTAELHWQWGYKVSFSLIS